MQKLISIVVAAAFAAASGAALADGAQKPPQEQKPLTANQKKEIKMSSTPGTANAQQAAGATVNKKNVKSPPKK
jgi:hypothetical protein